VFLVLSHGTKVLRSRSWEAITFEDTQKPAYQKRLLQALEAGGNLAPRLGPHSDGLCAIDIDIKDRVEEFLALTPQLRNAVRVYGRRGCQVFFRLAPGTPFPSGKNGGVIKLKCAEGEYFGEWRFGETAGAYSLILGQHPDDASVFWRIEGDTIQVLAFAEIKWPNDVRLPWMEVPQQAAGAAEANATFEHITPGSTTRNRSLSEAFAVSVAGKGGDDAVFQAACAIANGFALTEEQTYESLKRCFNPR
jgi:hypothetical protein